MLFPRIQTSEPPISSAPFRPASQETREPADVVTSSPADAEVTEASIARLIDVFYDKVRRDPRLGPIFDGRIVDRWPSHLATMRTFWSSVMLTSGRYKGNPMVAHGRLGEVKPEDFERWLALFSEACDELFPMQIADVFRMKAGRIAQSLQIGMFYRPEVDDPGRVS